ncbi:NfeD family protein [Kordiimonas pumila]|uniref:NfeD family protein n=1 Tax=Kordiimonas pumila TaxID=2161677 RepID=A0ABV7D9C4_9PROT|nr:NfeD family protein [Kordiimonas pumila]
MENFISWAIENAHWLWWAAGILLLTGEMVIPGVYLLWLGLAASCTGVVAWLMPGLAFEGHGLVFAALSVVSIYVGHKYFYGAGQTVPDKELNTEGKRHIGKIYEVVEPIKNGSGHVQVADSRWLAEGPDVAKGARVKVISVEGTVLVVEPVADK